MLFQNLKPKSKYAKNRIFVPKSISKFWNFSASFASHLLTTQYGVTTWMGRFPGVSDGLGTNRPNQLNNVAKCSQKGQTELLTHKDTTLMLEYKS